LKGKNIMSNKPLHTIRDKLLKATIWQNVTDDKKTFYTVNITNSYEKDGVWKETNSFAGAELLRLGNLSREAYNFITHQEQADKAARKHQESAPPAYSEAPQGGSTEYPN